MRRISTKGNKVTEMATISQHLPPPNGQPQRKVGEFSRFPTKCLKINQNLPIGLGTTYGGEYAQGFPLAK